MRPSLRVATLNIWNRSAPWSERRAAIRAGLKAIAPDVIGLQEVVRATDAGSDLLDQATELADGFGYHVAFGRAPGDRGYPFGNAILSRWPITRSDVFPLPRGGTEEYRNLLFAEIAAPFGALPFFTTHFNWKLHEGHVRVLQIREVAARVKKLAPTSGFCPIVVGDFNAEADSDEMRFMRGLTALGGEGVYYADAFLAAGDGSRGETFCKRNPFAAPMREPDRRIDYVFVRGPDDRGRGEVLDAKVCFDEPVDGVFPTDHFGVVATISTDA